jgi:tetratricopeptide (TPR) repeat protein
MKPTAILLISVVLSSAIAVTFVTLLAPSSTAAASGETAAPAAQIAELQTRVESLEQSLARLTARLEAMTESAVRAPSPAAVPATEGRGEPGPAPGKETAAGNTTGAGATAPLDVAATVETLATGKLSWEKEHEVWSKLPDEEKDRLLAAFEQRAKDMPHLADAHNELGEAYVHRMLTGDFAKMMALGPKAEKAFDRALEVDDHHWSARFNKAMSLVNQPDWLGRRPEAQRHFQTLVDQQERIPPEDKHAETYHYLGNLLVQQGKAEEAKEMWERGLKRHPGSASLKQKLGR